MRRCGRRQLGALALLIGCGVPVQGQERTSPFFSVPPAPSDSLRFGAPLAEFEAKDIDGRTWRTEDLRGKVTVIYIWHTFEARAVDRHDQRLIQAIADLPEIQRFYEEVRNARNIQVLTFCRDYDYTHAREYMTEKKYGFPVIADWVLARKLFSGGEWQSRQWLVNPEGRLCYPLRSWSLGRVLFEAEKAAGIH